MGASFFDGISADGLEHILQGLERRRYPAGAVVIAEGETCREMYVTQSGAADVFVADRSGVEHLVGHVGPGATLGEMSLFTGKPAVGTVRAVEDLELLVLTEADLEEVGRSFPQVYRNLGAILSERLALTNRLTLREEPGRLSVLEDLGAPALLAYALACSVAWHTRASTLLLVVDEDPEEMQALSETRGEEAEGARVMVARPRGPYALERLPGTTKELCARHEHVLLLVKGRAPAGLDAFRTVRLTGADGGHSDDLGSPASYTVQAWRERTERVGPDGRGVLRVPPLQPVDTAALETGRLPISTPAGEVLGWVARDLSGLKVGVALGAGSIRGFAHWGAIRAFERVGLPIDYLAGTSVGAAAAAIHAAGYSVDEGLEIFKRLGSAVFRPTLPIRSLLSSRAVAKVFQSAFGDRLIEDLNVPLGLVAADILTQREVVFRRGPIWKAVVASGSIPGVYPAQRIGPYTLVDGGILDPVPTGVVADMGADMVLGVRLVGRAVSTDLEAVAIDETTAPATSALVAILRAVEIMQTNVAPKPTDVTTVLVTPHLKDIPSAKLRRFSAGLRYVDDGAAAVEAGLPRMAAALPWLRPSG